MKVPDPMLKAHVHACLALLWLQTLGGPEKCSPVALPEFPEDHVELGEVALRVLAAELEGLGALGRHLQPLDQLLIAPAAGQIPSLRDTRLLSTSRLGKRNLGGGQAVPQWRAVGIP